MAAPGPLWPVFVGRSVQWLPTGLLSSSVALFALGPIFGVTWRLPQAMAVFGALVVVWLVTATVLLERLASVGRRTGSIQFAD